MSNSAFSEIDQALRGAQAPVSAAEAHGCLCGALCTVSPFPAQAWIHELLAEDEAESALQDEPALSRLYALTQRTLEGDDMDFMPLLPDDEATIGERVGALAQWAQGFLYGFGLGAPSSEQNRLPGDIPEVLRDLAEISRADDAGEEGEDIEQAYTELVEYLRAAVQLLYAELQSRRGEPSAETPRVTH